MGTTPVTVTSDAMTLYELAALAVILGAGGFLTGALIPDVSSGPVRDALFGVAGGALGLALFRILGLDINAGFGPTTMPGAMGALSVAALAGPLLQIAVRVERGLGHPVLRAALRLRRAIASLR